MDDSNGRFFDGLKDSSVSQLSIGDTTDFSSRNVNVHKDRLSGSEIVDNIADTQASEDLHTIHTNHTTNFNTEFGKESLLESGEDTEGETEGSEEDEEEEDDDDDESEEEEEDNEPPMLKYTRITKLPRNFFQRDSISSCLFHDKVFAFATHSGILHLTRPDFSPIRTFKCHRSSILSIYTDGEYFASASIDGTVVIGSIEDAADIIAFDFKRPVHAVVLDQSYKSTKIFISGGMAGEVIVSQRNWMGTRVDSRVDKEHGPIVGIYTLDDIIFWMNDNGITFYSIPAKTKLLHIPFADGDSIRPDLYWPKVHFPEVNSIIVCWGMNVWSFKVSLTNSVEKQLKLGSILSTAASSLRAVPDKKVELENHFKLDCLIAGIASFKDDQLLVLGLNPSGSRMNPPELKVVDMVSGEELHNDEVVSKNFQNMTLNDYHLGKYIGSNNPEYFLISANDAILVREFSLNDRYKWYVENKFFFRAWEISKFVADELDRFDTGLKYVDQLISEKKWHQAAKILCVVSKDISWDVDSDSESKKTALNRWQDMILKFLQEGQVDTIVPYIPTNPRMQPVVYDRVLKSYLAKQEYTNFSNYLKQWPIYTYSADDIEELLEEKHQSGKDDANDNYYLSNSLCYLYLQQRKFLLAISHLIKLHDPQALDILISENILATFVDQLVDIILLPYSGPINELGMLPLNKVEEVFAKSIKLLVQNRNSIPLSRVVDILSSDLQIILFLYFKNLSAIEPHMVVPYETKMVELYSKYEPKQLLTFLKKHSNYNIERSIEICEREDSHHQELIYLLGKIGETKKALSLIIDKLDDPALAIAFVIDSNDSELWHFMVSYSLDKPNFIKSLLQHRDEFGEKTLEVMKRIPEDAEIDEEMKIILRNITKANWLSKRVNLGVLKIIDDETKEVALEFLKIRRKGKLFNNED